MSIHDPFAMSLAAWSDRPSSTAKALACSTSFVATMNLPWSAFIHTELPQCPDHAHHVADLRVVRIGLLGFHGPNACEMGVGQAATILQSLVGTPCKHDHGFSGGGIRRFVLAYGPECHLQVHEQLYASASRWSRGLRRA